MNGYEYTPQKFTLLPPVCKNLLIINTLLYLLTVVLQMRGIDLSNAFGLHFFMAKNFRIWQLITYAFFHGSFSHLFFNMFAIWMFGFTLENIWGSKKFLFYCFVAAIGAALMQELTYYFQCIDLIKGNYEGVKIVANDNSFQVVSIKNYLNHFNTIGASGICFGLLAAFGMMFPNTYIYLYFLLPIKTKWFVIGYIVLELLNGILTSGDSIAHFAHLGGALAGIILILLWRKRGKLGI